MSDNQSKHPGGPTDRWTSPGLDGRKGLAVHLESVSRRFGDNVVLDDLDLDIPAGQFVAVLGRSGAGKSTLLRLLAGLDRGEVSGTVGTSERVSVVFQDARLLPWEDVAANVRLGAQSMGVNGAELDARITQTLAEVGLGDRARAWPRALSGGQRQRVALARALVTAPDLLLLDEPFSALDAFTRQEAQDLVVRLWQRHGPAVVMVTHDVHEAVLLADRVVVLNEGAVVADRTVDLPRPRRREDAEVNALVAGLTADLDKARALTAQAQPQGSSSSAAGDRSSWTRRGVLAGGLLGTSALVGFTRPSDASRTATVRVAQGGSARGATLRVAVQTDGVRSLLRASGQLDDTPYTIEFSQFTYGMAIVEALQAGKVDVGGVGSTPPIFGAAAGSGFRIVATTALRNHRDSSVLVKKHSGLSTAADLRGKRITVPKGSSAHGLLLNFLHRGGVKPSEVTFVYLPPADGAAAFTRGDADAWVIWEPFVTQQLRSGARAIGGGPPDEAGLNFSLASTDTLGDADRVAALRDYLRRLQKAYAWGATHLDAYARAWSQESRLPLSVTRSAISHKKTDQRPVTAADIRLEQTLADRLFEDKVIPKKVHFTDIVETGLMR